jgi:hypothetical protein
MSLVIVLVFCQVKETGDWSPENALLFFHA